MISESYSGRNGTLELLGQSGVNIQSITAVTYCYLLFRSLGN
jgi:hypothetical protein